MLTREQSRGARYRTEVPGGDASGRKNIVLERIADGFLSLGTEPAPGAADQVPGRSPKRPLNYRRLDRSATRRRVPAGNTGDEDAPRGSSPDRNRAGQAPDEEEQ